MELHVQILNAALIEKILIAITRKTVALGLRFG